jgi:nucleoid-associated protein YgaU
LLRLAALAGAFYLAACALLLLAAALVRRPRMAASALRLTPATVRRLVSGGGGLGLAAGTLLAGSPSPVAAAPAVLVTASFPDDDPVAGTTATMTRVDRSAEDDTGGRPAGDDKASPTATMTRRRPDAASRLGPLPAAPSRAPASTVPSSASPVGTAHEAAPAPATWVVEPRDSFWSIAAETLSTPGGGQPTDREIDGHWRRLMAANRDRLIDTTNPDLLVPGQELVLPRPG